MRLIEENKLWAGIVFDVPEDAESDELPEVCVNLYRVIQQVSNLD